MNFRYDLRNVLDLNVSLMHVCEFSVSVGFEIVEAAFDSRLGVGMTETRRKQVETSCYCRS